MQGLQNMQKEERQVYILLTVRKVTFLESDLGVYGRISIETRKNSFKSAHQNTITNNLWHPRRSIQPKPCIFALHQQIKSIAFSIINRQKCLHRLSKIIKTSQP